jgi:hypothetical protein
MSFGLGFSMPHLMKVAGASAPVVVPMTLRNSTSVAQTATTSGFNYLIYANNWWSQGHTYGNLNVWVAGGGWYWSGRVHLLQNSGLNAVYPEYVNNISSPSNYWDGAGGNYILFNIVASTTLYYRFTA